MTEDLAVKLALKQLEIRDLKRAIDNCEFRNNVLQKKIDDIEKLNKADTYNIIQESMGLLFTLQNKLKEFSR